MCQVLVVHPAEDRWTPVEVTRPFFDRLTVDKQLVLLDGCGHLPYEQPGLAQLEQAVARFSDRTASGERA